MSDRGEGFSPLSDGKTLQLSCAVLGDNNVDLVTRGRDHRARVEPVRCQNSAMALTSGLKPLPRTR